MSDPVEFAYTDFPVKTSPSSRLRLISRPIVPITILYRERFVQYQALLDTGADYNVFHADIADYLGINVTKGHVVKISGIAGTSIKGYKHNVILKLASRSADTEIVFSRHIPDHAIAVLGNQGFFNHFSVTFNYKSRTITIR